MGATFSMNPMVTPRTTIYLNETLTLQSSVPTIPTSILVGSPYPDESFIFSGTGSTIETTSLVGGGYSDENDASRHFPHIALFWLLMILYML